MCAACVVGAIIGPYAQKASQPDAKVIVAERIVIKDGNGKLRGRFGIDDSKDGSPMVFEMLSPTEEDSVLIESGGGNTILTLKSESSGGEIRLNVGPRFGQDYGSLVDMIAAKRHRVRIGATKSTGSLTLIRADDAVRSDGTPVQSEDYFFRIPEK